MAQVRLKFTINKMILIFMMILNFPFLDAVAPRSSSHGHNVYIAQLICFANVCSNPSDLVYKMKKIVGSNSFSAQFIKIIFHCKMIGCNINVLQQTACLVVNPITVGNFAFPFNCMPVGRTSDSMMVPT